MSKVTEVIRGTDPKANSLFTERNCKHQLKIEERWPKIVIFGIEIEFEFAHLGVPSRAGPAISVDLLCALYDTRRARRFGLHSVKFW